MKKLIAILLLTLTAGSAMAQHHGHGNHHRGHRGHGGHGGHWIAPAIIGGVILFKSLVVETPTGDQVGSWAWKPLVFIIAGNLLFGILLGGLPSIKLPAMGLIAAIYGTTLVVSMAGDKFKLQEVLILATVLSVMSYLAFIMLLKLQFPVWPTFISG